MRVTRILPRMLCDERGATAIEYGLIAALVVLAIMTAVQNVAAQNTGLWTTESDAVTLAM
jgi:pilus assembly protein Flp/PilA